MGEMRIKATEKLNGIMNGRFGQISVITDFYRS